MPIDATYLHLLVNHFPIVLSIVGFTALAVGAVTRREFFWRTGLMLMALAGVAAIVADLTGDAASDIVRQRAFVVRGTISAHDSAAGIALWGLLIAGAIAGYALWRARDGLVGALPAWLRQLVLLSALVGVGLVSYAGYLGGRIVHDAPVLQTLRPPDTTP